MKKLLSVIIALTMIITVFAVTASAAETYNVVYLTNGGLGIPVRDRNHADGDEIIIKDCTYNHQQATFEFSHWNTASDNSGTSYYPGDTFVVRAADANASKNISLYAIWEKVPGVFVQYQKNTDDPACTGSVDDWTEYVKGTEYTVWGVTGGYQYPLHRFDHWNTEPDDSGITYYAGDKFILNETTKLYAQWVSIEQEVIFCTVTFDANGGEGEMSPEGDIPVNGSIMAPYCDFTKEGYMFAGWNTKADGSGDMYEEWDDVPVFENLTLYAIWTESDAFDYNPEDGELGNIAVAVALSTLALGALVVVSKKKD